MSRALMPNMLTPKDLEPNWEWRDRLPAWGHTSVDFERRIDHDRLRRYRLARTRQSLQNSNAGSLLLFDVNNIRYVTATKIGEWERDKMCRFCLLTGDDSPYVWDFGSAAVHHKRHSDWLEPDHCLAGVVGMRGTIPPDFGLMQKYAKMIAQLIKDAGMADMPVGVDYAETAMFHALKEEGINVVDGQQIMLAAREIKNWDEIQLLTQAAAMVDGVYHMIYEELKPGVRENDIVALSNKMLYEMGSDDVEAINAISGERCNPHPHNFTDRLIRPGDQAFFDILQSYQGYRTCYYRTFNVGRATPSQNDAYVKAREWIDASIAMIKPGVTTDKVAEVWPTAESLGFPNEDAAFGLQFGHGLGLALHERPIISRAISLDHPMEIKTGMVFALETYCPATDGYSAARIEEEVVVTETGCEVISLFPAEELPIAEPVLTMAHLFDLTGRKALVTGGATGIGEGIALALAAAGADVALTYRSHQPEDTLAKIDGMGRISAAVKADFTGMDQAAASDVVGFAKGALGGLDILVNNAGIIHREESVDMPLDEWRRVLSVNLDSVWLLSQAAGRHMVGQGSGRIVIVSSVLGSQGGLRVPAYASSKHAVLGLTKALCNEWAPHGVNVNAIAPGYTATDNTQALRDDPDRSKALLERIPAGRFADPSEIAGAAVFLASDAATYCHGSVVTVDGGWLAR